MSTSSITPPVTQPMGEKPLGRFAVVNTAIVCFVPGKDAATTITDAEKTDIVNSTLLAQLGADEHSKSYEDLQNWLKSFLQISSVVGWTLQSGSNFKTATQAELHISIDAVTAKYIANSNHAHDLRVLEALLYLHGSHSPAGLQILEENGKMKSVGTFQFIMCEKNANQELMIRIFPYAFHTTGTVHSTIFQHILRPNTYQMKYMADPTINVLNTNVYDGLRDSVNDRVKDYLQERVAFLPI